jgi:hypothetical protein
MGKKRQLRYIDHFLYRIDMKSFLIHVSRHCQTQVSELKKKEPVLESVNTTLLNTRKGDEITVGIERAGEAEMDEMWSFIGKKKGSALHVMLKLSSDYSRR